MNERRYVIDSNALSKLTRPQRASAFFRKHCRVPSEVIHEARFFADEDEFDGIEYPTTGSLLSVLREVMATVTIGDTALIDLYANKGAADPLLVACAVEAKRKEEAFLLPMTWAIVTDDKAVRSKSAESEIETLSSKEFLALLPQDDLSAPEKAV